MPPSHRGPAGRPVAGLTLIELLVMVSILATIAFVAAPAMGTSPEFHLTMAEIQLDDACRQACRLATSQRSPHGIVFDVANDRFAIVQEDGEEAVDPLTKKEYITSFSNPNQARGIDLVAADFGSTGAVAVFDANGVPFEGGTIQLQCQGTVWVLNLDPVTGELSR